MIRGVAISPGIAVARAFRLDPVLSRRNPELLDSAGASAEVARFDQACSEVSADLDGAIERLGRQVGQESLDIFHAHRMLLRDPNFVGKVKSTILDHHLDAIGALDRTLQEYETLFARVRDEYIRERVTDVRDVVEQIVAKLSNERTEETLRDSDPIIIIAREIRPSMAALFDRLPVLGIATEAGGSTGHAAVLARNLGIPAVSGLHGLMDTVRTGDMLVVDGREGYVVRDPGPEAESAYRKMAREYVGQRDRLVENRDLPAVTADGRPIDLLANVNSAMDAAAAVAAGAVGVGLFRTEYVYLTHASVPDEEEQVEAYRKVIEASPGKSVVVRTLDLGGDKQVKYFTHYREANPFMGWRSIRMSAEHPEFFQTQLRAILRAATTGSVSLMFPMISTVEETRKLRRLIERARMALHQRKLPYRDHIPFGVMIEVPAAAMCIDHILAEVDFVSIGSNDLVQYMMAADRDNPKVAHLCDPCHPAVFRVLHRILRECDRRNKPVTLCGEMAGRPLCLLPLIGFGLRRASMSPAFIPAVKEMVRSVSLEAARRTAKKVLRMQTAGEVRQYLMERMRKLCPSVADMDTM